MKLFVHRALALIAITAAGQALATCPNGAPNWPACAMSPAAPVSQSTNQGQLQGQRATGQATSGASAGASGAASVSTGGSVDNSRATAWAPVTHGPGAAALAGAGVVIVPGSCGPRVTIVRLPVQAKRFGALGGQSDVEQGFDEVTAPSEVPYLDRDGMRLGHQVTTFAAVLGTSSAGSFSLGGFGRSGDGAQGGLAGSGGMQQLVMRVTVRECVLAVEQPVAVKHNVVFESAICKSSKPARRPLAKRPAACPAR